MEPQKQPQPPLGPKLIKLAPKKDASEFINEAINAEKTGFIEKAIATYNKILTSDPANEAAIQGLVRCHLIKATQAIKTCLDKNIKVEPPGKETMELLRKGLRLSGGMTDEFGYANAPVIQMRPVGSDKDLEAKQEELQQLEISLRNKENELNSRQTLMEQEWNELANQKEILRQKLDQIEAKERELADKEANLMQRSSRINVWEGEHSVKSKELQEKIERLEAEKNELLLQAQEVKQLRVRVQELEREKRELESTGSSGGRASASISPTQPLVGTSSSQGAGMVSRPSFSAQAVIEAQTRSGAYGTPQQQRTSPESQPSPVERKSIETVSVDVTRKVELENRLKERPNDAELMRQLVAIYFQEKDTVREKATLQRLIQVDPRNGPALKRLSELMLIDSEYEKAIKYLERMSMFSASDPKVWEMLGLAY
ncbi:MAG: hypothetical protein QW728_01585, partial [Thermoplasmata archaeon]